VQVGVHTTRAHFGGVVIGGRVETALSQLLIHPIGWVYWVPWYPWMHALPPLHLPRYDLIVAR
jgi:hypothetical protein